MINEIVILIVAHTTREYIEIMLNIKNRNSYACMLYMKTNVYDDF